jgi:outer membrane protein OmpA-like peptidoglycan-associated protein
LPSKPPPFWPKEPSQPLPSGPVSPLPREAWDTWLKDECKRFPVICKPQPTPLGTGPTAPLGRLDPKLGGSLASTALAGSLTLDGFGVDKWDITEHHGELLDAHAKFILDTLKRNPDSYISIVGHTDAPGKEKQNQELGQHRADAVLAELGKRGVPVHIMRTGSLGATLLKVDTKIYEPRNRRVEIYLNARSFFDKAARL